MAALTTLLSLSVANAQASGGFEEQITDICMVYQNKGFGWDYVKSQVQRLCETYPDSVCDRALVNRTALLCDGIGEQRDRERFAKLLADSCVAILQQEFWRLDFHVKATAGSPGDAVSLTLSDTALIKAVRVELSRRLTAAASFYVRRRGQTLLWLEVRGRAGCDSVLLRLDARDRSFALSYFHLFSCGGLLDQADCNLLAFTDGSGTFTRSEAESLLALARDTSCFGVGRSLLANRIGLVANGCSWVSHSSHDSRWLTNEVFIDTTRLDLLPRYLGFGLDDLLADGVDVQLSPVFTDGLQDDGRTADGRHSPPPSWWVGGDDYLAFRDSLTEVCLDYWKAGKFLLVLPLAVAGAAWTDDCKEWYDSTWVSLYSHAYLGLRGILTVDGDRLRPAKVLPASSPSAVRSFCRMMAGRLFFFRAGSLAFCDSALFLYADGMPSDAIVVGQSRVKAEVLGSGSRGVVAIWNIGEFILDDAPPERATGSFTLDPGNTVFKIKNISRRPQAFKRAGGLRAALRGTSQFRLADGVADNVLIDSTLVVAVRPRSGGSFATCSRDMVGGRSAWRFPPWAGVMSVDFVQVVGAGRTASGAVHTIHTARGVLLFASPLAALLLLVSFLVLWASASLQGWLLRGRSGVALTALGLPLTYMLLWLAQIVKMHPLLGAVGALAVLAGQPIMARRARAGGPQSQAVEDARRKAVPTNPSARRVFKWLEGDATVVVTALLLPSVPYFDSHWQFYVALLVVSLVGIIVFRLVRPRRIGNKTLHWVLTNCVLSILVAPIVYNAVLGVTFVNDQTLATWVSGPPILEWFVGGSLLVILLLSAGSAPTDTDG